MSVIIKDLFAIQEELDSRIFELHATSRDATRRDRVLALLVELGECANETKCFKYWSKAKPSPKDVIAEEFSDVVHFMLSLGIDAKVSATEVSAFETEFGLSELFLLAYQRTTSLLNNFSADVLLEIYTVVFTIAKQLGIEPQSIRESYLLKNQKNHQRQDNNY